MGTTVSTTHIHVAHSPSYTTYSHVTAPMQFVEAGGVRYAYRRFGTEAGMPLVFLPHFRAGMDHWDPLVTDGLGANRPVILFDNAGVCWRQELAMIMPQVPAALIEAVIVMPGPRQVAASV